MSVANQLGQTDLQIFFTEKKLHTFSFFLTKIENSTKKVK
jgi:hypothetical protein